MCACVCVCECVRAVRNVCVPLSKNTDAFVSCSNDILLMGFSLLACVTLVVVVCDVE